MWLLKCINRPPKSLYLLTESQSWLAYESALSTSLSCCSGSLSFVSLRYVLTSSVHILNSQSLHYATYSCFLFGFQCLQHHTFQIIPFSFISANIYFLTFRSMRTFFFLIIISLIILRMTPVTGSAAKHHFPMAWHLLNKKVPKVYPRRDTN